MAAVVAIVGPSGSGKSTGIKHLDPKTTKLVNADGKDLPFKGWRTLYNEENENYIKTSDPKMIRAILEFCGKKDSGVKTLVIDTMNAIMLDDEMKRSKEKDFDKWVDMANAVYFIIQEANACKNEDLTIFLIFHEESFYDDDGVRTTRILTNGKKLSKIQLETKITTVLWAHVDEGDNGINKHYFTTRKSKNNTCKSPEGMFDSFKIDNDFEKIRQTVINFNK